MMEKEALPPLVSVSTRQTSDVGLQPQPGKSEPGSSEATPEIHWAVVVVDHRLAERLGPQPDSRAGPPLPIPDVNAQDELGRTALHWAVVRNRLAAVAALLRYRPTEHDLRVVTDKDGRTPLHEAAIRGYDDIVEALVEYYEYDNGHQTSMSDYVNAKDTGQRTALHWAAARGHKVVVDKLSYSVKLDEEDGLGNTPMHRAAQRGYFDVVEKLSYRGAKKEPKNHCGKTPYDLAVQYDQSRAVQGFLDFSIDGNMRSEKLKALPGAVAGHGCEAVVCLALEEPELEPWHEDMVRDLIKTCPDPRCKNGLLLWAAGTGHADIVHDLMERGAHPMPQDPRFTTPLSDAARNGYIEVVKLLLADQRVHPEPGNTRYESPFGTSLRQGHMEVARLLLADPRVNPNLHSTMGDEHTALSWAAASGNKEVVEMLLADPRVNPKQVNGHGITPLEAAQNEGKQEIVEILRIDKERRSQLGG